jgi:hypothetical protein
MTNVERRQRIDAAMGAISDVFVLPTSGGGMAVRTAAFHVVHLRDLFESTALLLSRARAHGALILGRSMFETSLMLGALEEPSKRDAIASRWFHDSQARRWKQIGAHKSAGEDVTSMDEIMRENDRKLTAGLKELGITTKLPPELNPEVEARRQGRLEDLPNYVYAHGFVHGAYSALKHRVVHEGEQSTFHLDQAHDVDLLEMAANFVGRSALLGYRSFCRIIETPEPAALPRLLALIEFDDAGDVEGIE